MSNLTPEDLSQMLANNPALRIQREIAPVRSQKRSATIARPEAVPPVAQPKARRNRYSEQAGELGLKIRAHMEQLTGSIRLWLPYPPSTNARLAAFKGRMIKSAEAKSYQTLIQQALIDLRPLTGDLEVVMTINRPQHRGDIDNILKNVFDSLTGLAFVDDEQIAMLDAKRYDGKYAREFPGIHIEIKQIV